MPFRSWTKKNWLPWTVAAGGAVCTLALFALVLRAEYRDTQYLFDLRAAEYERELWHRFGVIDEGLRGAQALFAATEQVKLEDWDKFSEQLKLQAYAEAALAMGYVERVSPQDQERWVKDRLQTVMPGREIFNKPKAHGGQEFQPKYLGDHAVLLFFEPRETYGRVIGLDVTTTPAMFEVLEGSARENEIRATEPILMTLDPKGRPGYAIFAPVFKNKLAPTDPHRRVTDVDGWVCVAIDSDLMMRPAKANRWPGLTARLLSRPEPGVVHVLAGFGEDHADSSHQTWRAVTPFDVAGRQWEIEVTEPIDHAQILLAPMPWLVLIGGLTLSMLLVALIRSLAKNQRLALEQVNRAMAERDETGRQLDLALDAGRIGIWKWYLDTNELWWDPRMHDLYGTDPNEFTAKLDFFSKAVHLDDIDRVIAETQEAIQAQKPFLSQFRIVHPHKRTRYISAKAQVHLDEHGQPAEMIGVNQDITEQVEAERALYRSTRLLEDTQAMTRVGGWEVNLSDGKLYWTDQVFRIHDLPVGEYPPLDKAFEFYPEHVRKDLRQAFDRVVQSGSTFDLELPFVTAKGRRLYVRSIGEPVVENGIVTRVIGTFQDITDWYHARAELSHARDEAERANRAKSQFLANMSHELRTPMTAILGFAEMLAEPDFNGQQEQQQAAQSILRNGKHLLGLLNDVLDLSKIEAGKLDVDIQHTDMRELLDDVDSLLGHKAREKGLEFEVKHSPDVPRWIQTDRRRVRQILFNLLGNAIKFTPKGQVHLTVAPAQRLGTQSLRFEVRDTGMGIEPEVLPKLFQPFTQADNSMTRQIGGTGLGLTISRELAELLGGTVEVESTAGQGSVFTVYVELRAIGHETLGSSDSKSASSSSPVNSGANAQNHTALSGRVLLAEDGLDNQKLIRLLLRKLGIDVEIVENGRDAWETAMAAQQDGDPYALILMDMQMPIMDGYTATRKLREAGYTLPIVALTANAMGGDREKCLLAGCDEFASKPIQKELLRNVLAQFLSGQPAKT